jgi:two-component system, NarL family, response regulator NreC
MSIRILLADDHGVIRAGLRALLEDVPDMTVVAESSDGVEAVAKAFELKPDVVLMDLSMPNMGGLEATRQLLQREPGMRILILTVHEDESLLKEVIRAGAAGYIVKRAAQEDLMHAIRIVARGDLYVHPAMTRMLFNEPARDAVSGSTNVDTLTLREIEVLQLLAKGCTNRQIAGQLSLSPRTVEGHRANIAGKLGLHSRVELVEYAEKHGLLKNRDTS